MVKKFAGTWYWRRTARIFGVQVGFGPSSKDRIAVLRGIR
jgi:hypothetical protein